MADDDENGDQEPAVELGDPATVEGAPVERVAARLHYGIERSEVVRREGETDIRTPDGPRRLTDVLEASGETYFDRRQALLDAVRDVVGTGPVPIASGDEAAREG